MRKPFVTLGALLTIVVAFAAPRAEAASWTFTKIAETGDPPFLYLGMHPTINNAGTVGFTADDSVGGLFLSDGGPVTTAVKNKDGYFSNVSLNGPAINDFGEVAFSSSLEGHVCEAGSNASECKGIFVYDGTTIFAVMDPLNTTDASGPVELTDADINNDGTMLFSTTVGDLAPQHSLVSITRDGTMTTHFTGLAGDFPHINNMGTVAFLGETAPSLRSVFTSDGTSLSPIADTSGPFANFREPVPINDSGVVAFIAELDDGSKGIFTGDGTGVTLVVDDSEAFDDFFGICINNKNTIAFSAMLDSGIEGIFTGPDSIADKVIAVGDLLFGSEVTFVTLGTSYAGLNDNGQLAFFAELADGRMVIVRADPFF